MSEELETLRSQGWEINIAVRPEFVQFSGRTEVNSYAVVKAPSFLEGLKEFALILKGRTPYKQQVKATKQLEISFDFLFGQTD